MASVASQIVFHPAVSQGLKFGSTTLGRDKTYRAIQFLARFLAWYLAVKGNQIDAAKWTALKSHLGTARKLLRLGKPLEHLQAALRASLATGPVVEQITTISRQIAYFGYLSYDTFVWANSIKFISLNSETAKKVTKISNRLWLAGILFSIANGIFKTARLTNESKKLRSMKSSGEKDIGEEADRQTRLTATEVALASTRHQFTIDLLDVWIPAASLELVNFNEGLLGVLGLVSSVMGFRAQWQAVNGKK